MQKSRQASAVVMKGTDLEGVNGFISFWRLRVSVCHVNFHDLLYDHMHTDTHH
jgi:hypothetical protein